MSIAEEQYLKLSMAFEGKILIWSPDENTAKQVVSISARPDDEEDNPCANFADGKYVALYNVELSDFIVGKRLPNFYKNGTN